MLRKRSCSRSPRPSWPLSEKKCWQRKEGVWHCSSRKTKYSSNLIKNNCPPFPVNCFPVLTGHCFDQLCWRRLPVGWISTDNVQNTPPTPTQKQFVFTFTFQYLNFNISSSKIQNIKTSVKILMDMNFGLLFEYIHPTGRNMTSFLSVVWNHNFHQCRFFKPKWWLVSLPIWI